MCICGTESLLGIYKPPELSKKIHSSTSIHLDNTSLQDLAPKDLFVPPPAALDDPYERILRLEVLERHQELLYCSWITHTQSTTAVPAPPYYPSAHPSAHSERSIQVHTQEHTIQVHTQVRAIQVHTQNVLSKCTLRTCYPSAHSECAIQVHTQNVLSKCTLRMCYPSAHSERAIQAITCTTNLVHPTCASLVLVHPSRAPLLSCTHLVHHQSHALLVHCYVLSCTNLVHHNAISCTSRHHRAPLVLVYHSAISCTTRTCVPLHNLVHHC